MPNSNTCTLSSNTSVITISTHAAEWHSWKDLRTGYDYAWNGDPDWWAGRNPILFPFVGKLNHDGQYRYQGHTYTLGNHGFARHADFTLTQATTSTATFVLQANDDTRSVYPWEFKLQVDYALQNATLSVTITATNTDSKPMPCTLGSHPAFALNLRSNEKISDYRVEFDRAYPWIRRRMFPDSSWNDQTETQNPVQALTLSPELFADDVLAWEHPEFHTVALQGPHPDERVTLTWEKAEYFGLWAKPGAPFVCLEPWRGFGDIRGWEGDIMDRPYTHILNPGEKLDLSYTLTIGAQQEIN